MRQDYSADDDARFPVLVRRFAQLGKILGSQLVQLGSDVALCVPHDGSGTLALVRDPVVTAKAQFGCS